MKKRSTDTTEAKEIKKYTLFENSARVDLEKLRKRDLKKVPLRLNDKTVVLVKPHNCNAEYAAQKIKQLRLTL